MFLGYIGKPNQLPDLFGLVQSIYGNARIYENDACKVIHMSGVYQRDIDSYKKGDYNYLKDMALQCYNGHALRSSCWLDGKNGLCYLVSVDKKNVDTSVTKPIYFVDLTKENGPVLFFNDICSAIKNTFKYESYIEMPVDQLWHFSKVDNNDNQYKCTKLMLDFH